MKLPYKLVRENVKSGWKKTTSYATLEQAQFAKNFWTQVYVDNGLMRRGQMRLTVFDSGKGTK